MNPLKTVAIFFAKNMTLIHSAPITMKLKAVAILAVTVSPFAYMMEKVTIWTMLNRDFISGVLMAIAIDHFIGSVYHGFKKQDFTWKKNLIGLVTKLSLTAACGLLFEVMSGMTRGHAFLFEYLQLVTRLIVFLYPAGSAFMNMSALTNGVFPPIGWINKIQAFNKDLDVKKIIPENNNNENLNNDEIESN